MNLSFAQNLHDKTDIVIKHSNDRRRELEQFVTILSKRIEIEQQYSRGLEENARMAQKIKQGDDNIPTYSFTSFKEDCLNRSEQTKLFAKYLQTQILAPLKELILSQQLQLKLFERDWKKMKKQLFQFEQNIIKARQKYSQQYNDIEETLMINQAGLTSHKLSNQKRIKVNSKEYEIMKMLGDLERNYQKAVIDYNTYLGQYYADLQKILFGFQEQEKARLACQQQNIMKILILETSMVKNFQYDIVTITKHLQIIKNKDYIAQFILAQRSGKTRCQPKNKALNKTLLGQVIYKIINKQTENKSSLQHNGGLRDYVKCKFNSIDLCNQNVPMFQERKIKEFNTITKLIYQVWNGKLLTYQEIKSIKILYEDQYNRLVAWMYLREHHLNHKVVLQQKSYSQIAVLILQLIDSCWQFKDVFVARKITNWTFSIYSIQKDNSKKFLHLSLNKNKMFYSLDYWRAAIFEAIQENLYRKFNKNIEQEKDLKFISLVLSHLATFCHQMIVLGQQGREVKQCMAYFCKLYEISEEQSRQLVKTINSSLKIYKEMIEKQKNNTESIILIEETRTVSFDKIPSQREEVRKVCFDKFPSKKQETRRISFDLPQKSEDVRKISFTKHKESD